MKNLMIIRHAKSSWGELGEADRDRPLNTRGKKDAPAMGAWLKSRELKPDLMVSSAAKRAINTAQMIAEAVGYPGKAILIQDRMYLAEVSTLVDVIHALDDQHQRVYLIGHNPGCTELVHHLANETLGNLPTAGVASIQFPVDSWTHIMPGCGKLVFLEYPKK